MVQQHNLEAARTRSGGEWRRVPAAAMAPTIEQCLDDLIAAMCEPPPARGRARAAPVNAMARAAAPLAALADAVAATGAAGGRALRPEQLKALLEEGARSSAALQVLLRGVATLAGGELAAFRGSGGAGRQRPRPGALIASRAPLQPMRSGSGINLL